MDSELKKIRVLIAKIKSTGAMNDELYLESSSLFQSLVGEYNQLKGNCEDTSIVSKRIKCFQRLLSGKNDELDLLFRLIGDYSS